MENLKNDEIREILEEISQIAGVKWKSEINDNHYGDVNYLDVMELLKILELRKLNKNLEKIWENLGGEFGSVNDIVDQLAYLR